MTDVKCPFCLASIDVNASVCRHCMRDVGQLLKANQEIARLRRASPDPAGKAIRAPASAGADTTKEQLYLKSVLLVFYALSILHTFVLDLVPFRIEETAIVLALLTGLGATAVSAQSNVWILAVAGIVQPAVWMGGAMVLGEANFAPDDAFMSQLIPHSLSVGLAIFTGGLLATLMFPKRLTSDFWSFARLVESITPAGSLLDDIQSWIVRASLVGTAVLFIFTILYSG